ncbi:hypothetical protein C0Q70_10665 [Pomacea canaliculata]|uniref:Uncharacterized protein n=2 Tax=Pomacea canaliculata TaxID=400727 RepID=A0A2T7P3T2_POMCA|nr:hypothetical protein C0Q70_10665 [Pomacea canaliculata]
MHRRDDNESERLLLLRGHHRPAALHHQQRRPTSDPALGVHCLVAVGVTVTPDERDFQIPGVVSLLSSAARASRIPEIRGNRGHLSFIHLHPGVSVQSEETGEDNLVPAQVVEFAHRAPPGADIYHQDTHDIDLHLRRVLGTHLHLRPGSTIQSGVTEVSFTDIDVSLSSALGRRLAYRIFAGLDPHTVYEDEGDENGDTYAEIQPSKLDHYLREAHHTTAHPDSSAEKLWM